MDGGVSVYNPLLRMISSHTITHVQQSVKLGFQSIPQSRTTDDILPHTHICTLIHINAHTQHQPDGQQRSQSTVWTAHVPSLRTARG